MGQLRNEVTKLDDYTVLKIPDLVDHITNGYSMNKPSEDYFLRFMGIPASYYRDATEELQRRMLTESIGLHKDKYVRVAIDEEAEEVIGVGPDLHKDLDMRYLFKQLQGDTKLVTGSFLGSGIVNLFKAMDTFKAEGQDVLSGYNIMFSSMYGKGVAFYPSMLVVVCTNGAVDRKAAGKEFKIQKEITPDYLKMAASTIPGLARDMQARHLGMIEKVAQIPIVNPREYVTKLTETSIIPTTLQRGAYKILETISAGDVSDDPAYPREANNVWDIVQILSFVARAFKSPSTKLTCEAAVMDVLYKAQ